MRIAKPWVVVVGLLAVLAPFVMASEVAQTVIPIRVDRGPTLAELIEEGGYQWVSEGITEKNFPLTLGPTEPDIILLGYEHIM